MRRHLTFLLGMTALVLAQRSMVRAQSQDEPRGLAETRALVACVHSESDQLERVRQLMDQAAERANRLDLAEDVRRDARASIEALVERVRTHADRVRRCVEQARLPEGASSTERVDSPPHSLAQEHGTVHQIESGTVIARNIRVVRGERVDGAGSAPDSSVENAMRRVGTRLHACHDHYMDRLVRRAGEVHLSFTATEGGRITGSSVEQIGPFDAAMAQCIERAALTMNIEGQRGRSVYSYVLRFELD